MGNLTEYDKFIESVKIGVEKIKDKEEKLRQYIYDEFYNIYNNNKIQDLLNLDYVGFRKVKGGYIKNIKGDKKEIKKFVSSIEHLDDYCNIQQIINNHFNEFKKQVELDILEGIDKTKLNYINTTRISDISNLIIDNDYKIFIPESLPWNIRHKLINLVSGYNISIYKDDVYNNIKGSIILINKDINDITYYDRNGFDQYAEISDFINKHYGVFLHNSTRYLIDIKSSDGIEIINTNNIIDDLSDTFFDN